MKFVEIYSYASGKQKTVGRIELNEGLVEFKGFPVKFIDRILEEGIAGVGGKVFFPEDGLEFLQALQYGFSGSITRASEVKVRK